MKHKFSRKIKTLACTYSRKFGFSFMVDNKGHLVLYSEKSLLPENKELLVKFMAGSFSCEDIKELEKFFFSDI